MSSSLRVVVNADDFGRSVEVTDAIVRCLDAGSVTSTTVMATAPDFARSMELAPRFQQVSFGVHLTATEFAPLRSDRRLSPIMTDGAFDPAKRANFRKPSVLRALLEEWSAQFESVAEFVPVSHADSHHLVHWRPELMPVVSALVRRHNIRCLRTATKYGASGALAAKRRLWRATARGLSGAVMTDDFGTLRDFVIDIDRWGQSGSSIELGVHPGHPGYAAESELLDQAWRKASQRPIELIS
ncbi:MAG: ChbG/HpnK family deacetylase, partial [Actinomycetota bacterium]|nr:ChbG/HpnK family deacetylase [Actinomycetota bacterium]